MAVAVEFWHRQRIGRYWHYRINVCLSSTKKVFNFSSHFNVDKGYNKICWYVSWNQSEILDACNFRLATPCSTCNALYYIFCMWKGIKLDSCNNNTCPSWYIITHKLVCVNHSWLSSSPEWWESRVRWYAQQNFISPTMQLSPVKHLRGNL